MIVQNRERPGRQARQRGASPFARVYAPASASFGTETFNVLFGARLQTSLVPENATGSSTSTFTRNLAATVWGYGPTAVIADGPILLTVAANEARFVGARRIAQNNWSAVDNNGVALTTTNGASSLYTDAGGPFGYLAESAATNLALQSQTLATTWAVSNALDMNAVTEDQYVAPDGTTTADKLSTKATNAQHYLKQAFTFSATKYTYSVYLRYVATQRWAALAFDDGTTTWAGSFDLLNGVVGALAANTTSTITTTGIANVYRCTITSTTNAAAAAGNIYISMNNSDSATLQSWNAAGTELMGAWGAQLEANAFATSYILTTTVAVTRPVDVLKYPTTENISSTAGTMYVEWTTALPTSATIVNNGGASFVASSSGSPGFLYTGPKLFLSDPALRTLVSVLVPATTVQKATTSWGGSTSTGVVNGGSAVSDVFDGNMNITANFGIGSDENGIASLNGTIRNVRIYGSMASNSVLMGMTSP